MPLSREVIEEESGSRVIESHSCSANDLPNHLRVYLVDQFGEDVKTQWELFSIWEATETDVICGEASEVGELMNLSSIKLNYCPFCGKKLEINT